MAEARSERVPARQRRGIESPFNPILVTVGCLVTAYILVTSLIVIQKSYSPLPLQDSWALWQRYTYFRNYLAFLFEPHNEHRIVVTRLVYMVDRFAFHGRNLFPLLCSLALQALTGVELYRMARPRGEVSRLSRILLACVICSASLLSKTAFSLRTPC
jgi:hypothetical protein